MMKLDRHDMMQAVADGVRQAFTDLGSNWGRLDIPHEIVHDAIRQGVHDAVWQMITNATHAPCADFYEMVKEGVENAIRRERDDQRR